jgi:hypothetical protein
MNRLGAVAVVALLLSVGSAFAQESASFRLAEHVFNNGGRPEGGQQATSASFRVSLDAIGDSVTPGVLTGGNLQLGGGFVTVYPPPGEVELMGFLDATTLAWTSEPTTGTYNVYRGALIDVGDLTYGSCEQSEVPTNVTTDADPLSEGEGFFYLITAENLIAEEGTKGYSGSGAERGNPAPCP